MILEEALEVCTNTKYCLVLDRYHFQITDGVYLKHAWKFLEHFYMQNGLTNIPEFVNFWVFENSLNMHKHSSFVYECNIPNIELGKIYNNAGIKFLQKKALMYTNMEIMLK